MYKLLLLSSLSFLLAACGQPDTPAPTTGTETSPDLTAPAEAIEETAQTESERLNAWFDEKYEEQLQCSPITLTFLGRKERYGDLDDMSVAAEEAQLEWLLASVEELDAEFNYDDLNQEAQTSWDIWMSTQSIP